MNSQVLKPCPFCGDVPELKKVGRDWYRIEHQHVTECLLDSITFDYSQSDECFDAGVGDWNARATPAPIPDAKPERAMVVPDGWQLVPVEPTEELLDVLYHNGIDKPDSLLQDMWATLLAASPAPGDGQ